jgi:DNA-binding XRE family transcriptional regulator
MTQDDAAKHLGVSRPTFVQIEAGNRSVSSLELDKLAYLFGRDIREFVANAFHEEDSLAALFRAQPAVVAEPEVINKLRECMALGRELTNLERLVGIDRDLSAVASYPFPTPKARWEAVQQGQRLAEEERRRLGLGHTPLPNMSELLESQGVRTGLVDLPNDVSGLTLSDRKVGLFVVANGVHHCLRPNTPTSSPTAVAPASSARPRHATTSSRSEPTRSPPTSSCRKTAFASSSRGLARGSRADSPPRCSTRLATSTSRAAPNPARKRSSSTTSSSSRTTSG